jgi:ribose transport system permease protein
VTAQEALPIDLHIAWGRRLSIRSVQNYAIIFTSAALFVVLSFSSGVFLTKANLLNILDQQAPLGIIVCAVTIVMIAGGFDLSVGAVFALSGVLGATVANSSGPAVGLLVGCLVGLGCGLANGLLVTVGRINSFIVTLSSAILLQGVALAKTGGFLVTVKDPGFTTIGTGSMLGVKDSVWLFAAVFALSWFLLAKTAYGRRAYAVGGNPEAARLSGVRVAMIRASTFAMAGLAAGLSGMIVASRVATAQADTGSDLALNAIAAVVIGGTSISGGEGAVWRSFLGVVLLAMIGNGFNLLNIDPVYQKMFQGGLILIAVGIDAWARRGRR